MSGGGGSGSSTTVTKADPWSGQQPYLTTGFARALDNLNSSTPQYYPHSTVAPQSANTQQALGMQWQRAANGSPVMRSANNLANNTMNGAYLNSNPYLDANFNAGAQQIKNNYMSAVGDANSGFSGAGRYGSGAQLYAMNNANNALATNLGNLYNSTYLNNYNNERGYQNSMASLAPTLANQDYTDLSKMSDVGAAYDSYNQSLVDADVDRWNFLQNLPYNKLNQYMGLVNGTYGMDKSTSTPVSGNSALGNALSGVATGIGAYNAFKG